MLIKSIKRREKNRNMKKVIKKQATPIKA